MVRRYSGIIGLLSVAAVGWSLSAPRAEGFAPGAEPAAVLAAMQPPGGGGSSLGPKFVEGELVVRLRPGADAKALANSTGMELKNKLRFAPNTYVFRTEPLHVPMRLQYLRRDPSVHSVTRNLTFELFSLPIIRSDDPLLERQWALPQIRGRDLWGITVGQRLVDGPEREVLVGVIDADFELSHPDLAENLAPGAWDFGRDAPYMSIGIGINHGTGVASCIAPVNNNAEGIAGLPWEAVKLLACHIAEPSGDLTFENIVDAIYYCIDQNVDVINMSFGAYVPDDMLDLIAPMRDALLEAYGQGIVLVSAAGNGGPFAPTSYPAGFPEVISVGATGPNGEIAVYSQRNPEVVAPGGNISGAGVLEAGVIVADSFAGFLAVEPGYGFTQGTSFASPYVAGAVALLLSQGAVDPGLPPAQRIEAVRALLRETARNPFGRGQHPDYGWGIIDVNQALRASTSFVEVLAPTFNEITPSFSEPVQGRLVRPGGASSAGGDIRIFQNGEEITGAVTIDSGTGIFDYTPNVDTRFGIGVNRLDVVFRDRPDVFRSLEGPAIMDEPNGVRIPARSFRFRVEPHVELAGLKMLSVPYELQRGADSLSFLFGGNLVRLARWLPEQGRYAVWSLDGTQRDPEASLTTRNAGVAKTPIGVGFWSRTVTTTQVQLLGTSERASFYEIPIRPGFNMIGSPFPFRVPWSVVLVRFGNEVLTIDEAVSRRLMRNALWRYMDGAYTFQALPDGELVDWESHWVRSNENLTLIVPRLPSALVRSSAVSDEPTATALQVGETSRPGASVKLSEYVAPAPAQGAGQPSGRPAAGTVPTMMEGRRAATVGEAPHRRAA